MDRQLFIRDIFAREIFDSHGNLTVEAEVLAGEDTVGTASVPSEVPGEGDREAGENIAGRENAEAGENTAGRGNAEAGGEYVRDTRRTEQAAETMNSITAAELIGRNVFDQEEIDRVLTRSSGISEEERPGGNVSLAVSAAAARAAACSLRVPLYRCLGGVQADRLPVPMVNVLDGGVLVPNRLDLKEIMVAPAGKRPFYEGLADCAKVYHALEREIRRRNLPASVSGTGGFTSDLGDTKESLRAVRRAAEQCGLRPGRDIVIAVNAAADDLYDAERKVYIFRGEGGEKGSAVTRNAGEMTEYYEDLMAEFPICSIEDPLGAEDWEGWKVITKLLGERVRIVGAELFGFDIDRLRRGIRIGAANAVSVRVSRARTLTEVFEIIREAKEAGYDLVISQGHGETEDSLVSDIAVAFRADQIRAGAPCGAEHMAKYNRLLRIGECLGWSSKA